MLDQNQVTTYNPHTQQLDEIDGLNGVIRLPWFKEPLLSTVMSRIKANSKITGLQFKDFNDQEAFHTLNKQEFEKIFLTLSECPNIKILDIPTVKSDNIAPSILLAEMFFKYQHSIEILNLPNLDFQDYNVKLENFAKAIASPDCKLKTLTLNYCRMSSKNSKLLKEALKKNTSITKLDIRSSNFESLQIAEIIESNKSIKYISAYDIHPNEANPISIALAKNSTLETLELTSNYFDTKKSTENFFSFLKNPKCNVKLIIAPGVLLRNNAAAEGLLNCLSKNKTVNKIDFNIQNHKHISERNLSAIERITNQNLYAPLLSMLNVLRMYYLQHDKVYGPAPVSKEENKGIIAMLKSVIGYLASFVTNKTSSFNLGGLPEDIIKEILKEIDPSISKETLNEIAKFAKEFKEPAKQSKIIELNNNNAEKSKAKTYRERFKEIKEKYKSDHIQKK
ncbi:MAG: hypothetical protein J0H68_01805 [Sphingobacteriia bacterium]|nr:hypothetical protein [Sphingobacteriia bacterium]